MPEQESSNVGESGAVLHGRALEIRALLSRIGHESPECCSIVGIRRIGKSSLLQHVHRNLTSDVTISSHDARRRLYIYLDVANLKLCKPAALYEELIDRTLKAAVKLDVDIERPTNTGQFRAFDKVLGNLASQQISCIYFLDEFDSITAQPEFDASFFDGLRSLAVGYPVAFVTSSHRELTALCHSREISLSPFFNIFITLRLRLLETDAARQLIKGIINADPGESSEKFLLDLAGRHPYLLKIACDLFLQNVDFEKPSQRHFEKTRMEFVRRAQNYFSFLWKDLSRSERRALLAAARGQLLEHDCPEISELRKKGLLISKYDPPTLFCKTFRDFVRTQRDDDKLRKLTSLICDHLEENLLESWLNQQTEASPQPLRGTLAEKLEEYLLLNDEAKINVLELLGLPTLHKIAASLTADEKLSADIHETAHRILSKLGFIAIRKPKGISTFIDYIVDCIEKLSRVESHNELLGLGMEGCKGLENVLQELCEFYAAFFFGLEYQQKMTESDLLPKRAGETLHFSQMTFGQRRETLSNLESLGQSSLAAKFKESFNCRCTLIPSEIEQSLNNVSTARNCMAHNPLTEIPFTKLKRKIKDTLEHIKNICEIWKRERIYPLVVVHGGERVEHHDLRVYLAKTEKGSQLSIRTRVSMQPGSVYYCFYRTNPVAINPVLIPKQED
jgi:hypothetical protein